MFGRASRQITGYGMLLALSYAATLVNATAQDTPPAPAEAIQPESIFYSDNEVASIRQALSAYANRGDGGDQPSDFNAEEWLNQAGEIKQARSQERYFTYPQFFLESLVFRSDADWTVWINGQRITPEANHEKSEIKIRNIDKHQVSLEWRPADMESVRKTWAKVAHGGAVVDESAGIVSFMLKPNQTFSSYVMKVLEGKVLPVTIDNQEIERDFQAKTVSDNSLKAVQDVFSSTDSPVPESASGEKPAENPVDTPVSSGPAAASEAVAIYGTTEEKKQ